MKTLSVTLCPEAVCCPGTAGQQKDQEAKIELGVRALHGWQHSAARLCLGRRCVYAEHLETGSLIVPPPTFFHTSLSLWWQGERWTIPLPTAMSFQLVLFFLHPYQHPTAHCPLPALYGLGLSPQWAAVSKCGIGGRLLEVSRLWLVQAPSPLFTHFCVSPERWGRQYLPLVVLSLPLYQIYYFFLNFTQLKMTPRPPLLWLSSEPKQPHRGSLLLLLLS